MEILFSKCKRAHSRRIFASKVLDKDKKVINMMDLKNGMESFKNHRQNNEPNHKEDTWKNMYV